VVLVDILYSRMMTLAPLLVSGTGDSDGGKIEPRLDLCPGVVH